MSFMVSAPRDRRRRLITSLRFTRSSFLGNKFVVSRIFLLCEGSLVFSPVLYEIFKDAPTLFFCPIFSFGCLFVFTTPLCARPNVSVIGGSPSSESPKRLPSFLHCSIM